MRRSSGVLRVMVRPHDASGSQHIVSRLQEHIDQDGGASFRASFKRCRSRNRRDLEPVCRYLERDTCMSYRHSRLHLGVVTSRQRSDLANI
jgi:hypothetical protein